MKIWTQLIGQYYLCTLVYDRDGTPEVDCWSFHQGPNGPELPESLVSSDLAQMVEREFERWGLVAFSIGALYRLNLEEGEDAA